MTGPQHYRIAEDLLDGEHRGGFGITSGHVNVARGIGHALLALTAAVADLLALTGEASGESSGDWKDALT